MLSLSYRDFDAAQLLACAVDAVQHANPAAPSRRTAAILDGRDRPARAERPTAGLAGLGHAA